ncbi:hypothetical protein Poli38472_011183 [Pythium oligandrum]|uniref:Uncharacterized protein n=1 Tax=Pythium oligandrum TaxID=41045 RepID=A0A8K1CRB8_PYTOL|nr:hypothetical protein Poli38472_011183 [Pythium oligandrum]|eukprot:TMW67563.1 hypothetical protein Poli38472_011183 [Pythium oligandrum]
MLSQATMIDDFCTFFGMEGVAPDDRRVMWRQIAYALFCDASRSAISSLTFECESITLEDIAAMEEVFDGRWQPDDGAVTPTDIDTATAESAQHVCVTNDAMVRVDGALVSLAILGLSSRDELVVVDDDTGTEWMEVKASSIGRLYIQCEDIVDAGVISDRVLIQQSSRLRSLMLICDRFEPGAAASFIKLVGRGLTTLRIPCKTRRWITASDTKQILQSCPNLQFLGVEHADLKSINVFIEAYEHGWCTLRALSLWDVRVANESLVTFAEKLKDPHHPMTRCLTEFRFIFDEVANSNSYGDCEVKCSAVIGVDHGQRSVIKKHTGLRTLTMEISTLPTEDGVIGSDAMTATIDARWRILEPFARAFRVPLTLEDRVIEGSLQCYCAGVSVTVPAGSSTRDMQRTRNFVDLLHVLWTLDRDAWKRLLRDGADIPFTGSMRLLPADETPYFALRVSFSKATFHQQLTSCIDFIRSPSLSAKAAQAKQDLLSAYNQADMKHFQSELRPLRVRLQFQIHGADLSSGDVDAFLIAVVNTIEDIKTHLDRSEGAHDTPTSLTSVVLDATDLDLSSQEVTADRARLLMRLESFGIPFHNVKLRLNRGSSQVDDVEEEPHSVAHVDRLLSAVLPARWSRDSTEETSPWRTQTLSVDQADLTEFASLCSTVSRTQHVKNLQLRSVFLFDSPFERYLKWQWLVQALSGSSSSIKHVAINETELELSDAVAVASILEDGMHMSEEGGIETLALSTEAANEETISTILALLRQLHHSLTSLSVYVWMNTLSSPFVSDILSICQNLRFLDLSSVELESFDLFVDAYDAGTCHIQSLALHSVRVENTKLAEFVRALADVNSRPAQVLRELCLDSVGTEGELVETNLEELLQMLNVNPWLQYLEVHVDDELHPTFVDRFEAHDEKWLPVAAERLSIESKLAFLSTVQSTKFQRTQTQSVMARLDDRVLTLVLEYAATAAQRHVYLEIV